jgi:predicted hydrocarbon binding protein
MMRTLVTGGSAGIGLAICRACLDAGRDVVSLDRRPSPIDHVAPGPIDGTAMFHDVMPPGRSAHRGVGGWHPGASPRAARGCCACGDVPGRSTQQLHHRADDVRVRWDKHRESQLVTNFRDRLIYDAEHGEYRDGDIRYMMIRPDALMGMIAELPEDARPLALEAFARSIRNFGGRSARSYRATGAADVAALLGVIQQTAPQLGWGRWQLERTPDGLALTVENSPFAAGAGRSPYPVCAPIRGMLTAVGEMVLGEAVVVAETACAATGASCCRFSVSRAASLPEAAAAPP